MTTGSFAEFQQTRVALKLQKVCCVATNVTEIIGRKQSPRAT